MDRVIKQVEIMVVNNWDAENSFVGLSSDKESLIKEALESNSETNRESLEVSSLTIEIIDNMKKYEIIESIEDKHYISVELPLDKKNARQLIEFSKTLCNYDSDDLREMIFLVGGTEIDKGEDLYW